MSKNNSNFFKVKSSWSVIKDKLLGCYLAPYFQKVLITHKPITYVDCFAGKGKFEDGNAGSPLIALQLRDECLDKSAVNKKSNAIQMWFIELNHSAALLENVAQFSGQYGTPHVISGKYEEQIESLLRSKREQNVFLYIDPYGIRALDMALFDRFGTFGFSSFEMLINFNSFGFFRDACRVMSVDYREDEALQGLDELVEYEPTEVNANQQSEGILNGIAGGDYWKQIVRDFQAKQIDGYQAEQRLSDEYKQRLRKRYSYVLDMPIRLKPNQRPKYRMIHVCDHEDGCFLMAENMQKRKDELFTNIQQSGQMSIFDFTTDYASSVEGIYMSREQIKSKVKDHLLHQTSTIGIKRFLATFVNDYGLLCEFSMIYEILGELQIERVADITREPPFTPKTGRPSAFWEEKGDHKVYIGRCE